MFESGASWWASGSSYLAHPVKDDWEQAIAQDYRVVSSGGDDSSLKINLFVCGPGEGQRDHWFQLAFRLNLRRGSAMDGGY